MFILGSLLKTGLDSTEPKSSPVQFGRGMACPGICMYIDLTQRAILVRLDVVTSFDGFCIGRNSLYFRIPCMPFCSNVVLPCLLAHDSQSAKRAKKSYGLAGKLPAVGFPVYMRLQLSLVNTNDMTILAYRCVMTFIAR